MGKILNNQNTLTILEFLDLQYMYLIKKMHCFKKFGKVKIIKATEGFKLMTYGFVDNALNHCATLLDNNMGKEKN